MEALRYNFETKKNEKLKEEKGVGFEDMIIIIEARRVLEIIGYPNVSKYPNQRMLVVDIEGCVYLVPFVQQKNIIFFKTIFASQKATKRYLSEINKEGG